MIGPIVHPRMLYCLAFFASASASAILPAKYKALAYKTQLWVNIYISQCLFVYIQLGIKLMILSWTKVLVHNRDHPGIFQNTLIQHTPKTTLEGED